MSDTTIFLVPKYPNIPVEERKLRQLRDMVQVAYFNRAKVSVVASDTIQFFDAGGNFESMTCSHCGSPVEMAWWSERMGADYDGAGFRLGAHAMPCCQMKLALSDLTYNLAQAFGRSAVSIDSFRGELLPGLVDKAEALLGMPIVVVHQRN